MTLTQAASSTVECTSTQIIGTTQVEVDLKIKKLSLYDEIFDALKAKGYCKRDVSTLLRLFSKLGRDVTMGTNKYFHKTAGVHRVAMNMAVHDVLDTFMEDRELASAGSLHEKVNHLFLPAGKTFVHDVAKDCVLEVRDI